MLCGSYFLVHGESIAEKDTSARERETVTIASSAEMTDDADAGLDDVVSNCVHSISIPDIYSTCTR